MKIIQDIKEELEKAGDLHKSGTAFMSHVSTLKKGKYLVVGLNPGGASEGCLNIGESLDNFKRDDYSPFDEEWANKKYQKGIKELFRYLAVDLKTICVTNFIYERSRTEKDLPTGSIEAYRNILRKVIGWVGPQAIIILGVTVFRELRTILNGTTPEIHDSGHKRFNIYTSTGSLEGQQITLLCLPHLSRYALYTKEKQLEFIKAKIT